MVFEKVAAMIAERIGADVSTITLESKFEDMGIDSLDVMELLMQMEDEFSTEIEVGDAKLVTMEDLVKLIESKIGTQA